MTCRIGEVSTQEEASTATRVDVFSVTSERPKSEATLSAAPFYRCSSMQMLRSFFFLARVCMKACSVWLYVLWSVVLGFGSVRPGRCISHSFENVRDDAYFRCRLVLFGYDFEDNTWT